jgi:hypothetical protein
MRPKAALVDVLAADEAKPVDDALVFGPSPPGLTRWSMLTRTTSGPAPWIAGSSPAMTGGIGVTFLRFDNRAQPLKIVMASAPSFDGFDP